MVYRQTKGRPWLLPQKNVPRLLIRVAAQASRNRQHLQIDASEMS